jgi:hypothetical protein
MRSREARTLHLAFGVPPPFGTVGLRCDTPDPMTSYRSKAS